MLGLIRGTNVLALACSVYVIHVSVNKCTLFMQILLLSWSLDSTSYILHFWSHIVTLSETYSGQYICISGNTIDLSGLQCPAHVHARKFASSEIWSRKPMIIWLQRALSWLHSFILGICGVSAMIRPLMLSRVGLRWAWGATIVTVVVSDRHFYHRRVISASDETELAILLSPLGLEGAAWQSENIMMMVQV